MLTPYQFASNKPINSIDLDGLESLEVYIWTDVTGKTTKLEVPRNDPYGLGKGTLYHNYTVAEVCHDQLDKSTIMVEHKRTDVHVYVPPDRSVWEQIGDFFSDLGPQVKVWGSGTENFGSKADPNKPVYSINLKSEEWEILTALPGLMTTPDLNGADLNKALKLFDKFSKQIIKEDKKGESSTTSTETPSVPVDETPSPRLEPGKPTYIYRRLDNYGSEQGKEKKGSLQGHAYFRDTIIRRIKGNSSTGVDTFEIKQKE